MAAEFSEKSLIAVLSPLGDYLQEMVVCGSWTLFIYRNWVLKRGDRAPVRTLDVDLAVPKRIPLTSEPLEKRLADAGFKEDLKGESKPPVIHFKLPGAPYLEFVTPHKGNRDQGTREVQAGVTAQELRFLEIVLDHYREAPIPGTALRVRVTTPAAYIYQKGLSFVRRMNPDKKAKDLAYLFDLLYNLPELRADALRNFPTLVGRYPDKWYGTFLKNLGRYFPDADGEGVSMVLSQKADPYSDMIGSDRTTGAVRFRQAAYRAFADFLADLPRSR